MKMTAQDREWQRESDARTLAEAETIKSDIGRLKGATSEAKKMVKRDEERAKSMKKVAKKAPVRRRKAAPRSIPTGRGSGGTVVRSNTNTPLSRSKRR